MVCGADRVSPLGSYIMPEDAYIERGVLVLRCRKAAGNAFGSYPYSEGFVHTSGKKNDTYGYVEMRARFPAGRGVWPAWAAAFRVWRTTAPMPALPWEAVTVAPVPSNGWWCVCLPAASRADEFYRFQEP